MKKRILLLCLAITAGLFLFPKCYGASGTWITEEQTICTRDLSYSFVFRHSSGGYWYISNDSSGSAKIYDFNISIPSGYAYCSGYATTIYSLPAQVVSALKGGGQVKVYLEHPGGCSSVDYSYFNYWFNGKSSVGFDLRLSPKIAAGYTVGSYVSGINVKIPLVHYAYGRNLYTVYPAVGNGATAAGWFSVYSPSSINSPYIHPSQIKNNKGVFKSGTTINVNGSNKSGLLYSVGKNGSLVKGGDVTLEFYCPIRLRFTVMTSTFIPDDKTDPDPGTAVKPDSDPGDDPNKPKDPDDPNKPDPNAPDKPSTKSEDFGFKLRIHRKI